MAPFPQKDHELRECGLELGFRILRDEAFRLIYLRSSVEGFAETLRNSQGDVKGANILVDLNFNASRAERVAGVQGTQVSDEKADIGAETHLSQKFGSNTCWCGEAAVLPNPSADGTTLVSMFSYRPAPYRPVPFPPPLRRGFVCKGPESTRQGSDEEDRTSVL